MQTIPISQTDTKISIYRDKLTKSGIAKQIAKIHSAFPEMNKNQINILKERIKANNFTDKRFEDAVNFVIDNFKYGNIPHIADFIRYDQTIDLFSYNDLLEMHQNNKDVFKMVIAIDVGLSVPKYVWKWDYEKYPFFKKWEIKKAKSSIKTYSDNGKTGTKIFSIDEE